MAFQIEAMTFKNIYPKYLIIRETRKIESEKPDSITWSIIHSLGVAFS